MNTKNKPVACWLLAFVYLGMTIVLAACGGVTPVPTEVASWRLDDGAVEVQNKNHAWIPVGGETTFELVGKLESTNPWMVTHNTFATRDYTQIAEGLKVGDPVRVKGIILKDATWLAESIEPAKEKVEPAITLVGKVNSIDPWVVSVLRLNVTADTTITGKIAPDMIVHVGILLGEDGTWKVLSIASLSNFTEIPGCATVTATVASVNGDEVQFTGWPPITLDKDVKVEDEAGNQAMLSPNRLVLVVVCSAENGKFMITKIIALRTSVDPASANGEIVLLCHKPDQKSRHTLRLPAAAVPAHLGHGDKLGPCP
jgi:uncharacterized protein DUF5666